MADHAHPHSLDEIEQQIAQHRSAYLIATWRADNPRLDDIERAVAAEDAKAHEAATNELLDDWDDTARASKAWT